MPNSGAVVSSGEVRAAPTRCWLMFRKVQPPRKCTIPAIAKAIIPQAVASPSADTSPLARVTHTSTDAAIASWMNVDAYGSSMSRTARRLRLWKSPNPIPETAAHSAPVTSCPDGRLGTGFLDRAAEVQGGHLRVVEHVVGLAVEQYAATLHDDPVVREPEPEAHVLLYQQDRPAPRDHALDAVVDHLQRLRVESERRLVEQHHLRLHHQRASELDHAPLPAREVAGLVRPPLAEHWEG